MPAMDPEQYEGFKQDISRNGLREPVYLWRGQVIDGRHRYQACEALGITPRFDELDCAEQDLEALVDSLNHHRRHLTVSQLAMRAAVASRASTHGGYRHGVKTSNEVLTLSNAISTQLAAAKRHGVSHSHVQRAKRVLDENEALALKVHEGAVTLQGATRKLDARMTKKWQVDGYVAKVGEALETEENTNWQMVISGRLGKIQRLIKDLPDVWQYRPKVPNQRSWDLEVSLIKAVKELDAVVSREVRRAG